MNAGRVHMLQVAILALLPKASAGTAGYSVPTLASLTGALQDEVARELVELVGARKARFDTATGHYFLVETGDAL